MCQPVSLKAYLGERAVDFRTLPEIKRNEEVAGLGAMLMREIGRAIPALPVSLVAAALVRAGGRRLSTLELKASVAGTIIELRKSGAQVYVPRADEDYAVDVGLRMLTLRRLVTEHGGLWQVASGNEALTAYYANAIAHLLPGEPSSS